MDKIFISHELKTIEVDTEKKIFRINGEDFGNDCTGFLISCTPDNFRVDMEIDTTVRFATVLWEHQYFQEEWNISRKLTTDILRSTGSMEVRKQPFISHRVC